MTRPYYSQRAGRGPAAAALTLDDLKRVFAGQFSDLEREGYFQEYLGYDCVDAGFVPGLVGTDLQAELLLSLRKPHLWPVHSTIESWSEDDLFDMVEFMYDHISKPTERHYHSFGDCGWHCTESDRNAGRTEFRERLNRLLRAYDSGFELSDGGEVFALSPSGLEPLLEAPVPGADAENIISRVEAAKRKFRLHRASESERRDAVRELADVLEYLRPKLKSVLASKDEQDLFHLANSFGIRHHREDQKTNYDKLIWMSWMFYYYLATIHATLRLLEKASPSES